MKYAFIQTESTHHKIIRMCDVLSVSSSGYYDWVDRPKSPRAQQSQRLVTKIRCFHEASHRVYGSPRIHEDLVESGETVGVNRVAKLMKHEGIQSKVAKRFVITTDSRKTTQPAPDRLQQRFYAAAPNRVWVSDTTFIPTREGWLFLAVVLDLFSRQVIGWAMGDHNNQKLVSDALTMSIWRRGKVKDVIVHSDQGATYASKKYQSQLRENKLLCSMSRKGECLDNAVAESFFGSLKTEWVDDEDYHSKSQARQSLFEYIEMFYNRRRRHSYLGNMSPVEYEQRHASK